jgi:hypothetical protein
MFNLFTRAANRCLGSVQSDTTGVVSCRTVSCRAVFWNLSVLSTISKASSTTENLITRTVGGDGFDDWMIDPTIKSTTMIAATIGSTMLGAMTTSTIRTASPAVATTTFSST